MPSEDEIKDNFAGRKSMFDMRMNPLRSGRARRAISFDTDPIKEEPDEGEIQNYDFHVTILKKSFSNSINSCLEFNH